MTLHETTARAVADVDAINRSLANALDEYVSSLGDDIITLRQQRAIMRRVERELSPRYGSTQALSRRSLMFRAIAENMAIEAGQTYDGFFRALNREMRSVDNAAWERVHDTLISSSGDTSTDLARIYGAIHGPGDATERVLRASRFDPNRRWVDPNGYRLSDRIWKMGRDQRRAIDSIVKDGIRRGQGPVTLGRRLNEYLNPDYAPLRYTRDGRIVRRIRGKPSGASAARRLARTELQHINHEATVTSVKALGIKGTGVQWALSIAHPKIDICDSLASSSSEGYPKGVYRPEEFPGVPHAQCICSARPYMPSREDVLNQLSNQYPDTEARYASFWDDFDGDFEAPEFQASFAAEYERIKDEIDDKFYENLGVRVSFINNGDLDSIPYDLQKASDLVYGAYEARRIRGLGTVDDIVFEDLSGADENTLAFFQRSGGVDRITFNVWEINEESLYEERYHLARYDIRGLVDHEHAHWHHSYLINRQTSWGGGAPAWEDMAGNYRHYSTSSWLPGEETIANQISNRAAWAPEEFVAETYSLMVGEGFDPEEWPDVGGLYWLLKGPDVNGDQWWPSDLSIIDNLLGIEP